MDTIAQIADAMQMVLSLKAEQLGRRVGFVQRSGKLSGNILVIVVHADVANPQYVIRRRLRPRRCCFHGRAGALPSLRRPGRSGIAGWRPRPRPRRELGV